MMYTPTNSRCGERNIEAGEIINEDSIIHTSH